MFQLHSCGLEGVSLLTNLIWWTSTLESQQTTHIPLIIQSHLPEFHEYNHSTPLQCELPTWPDIWPCKHLCSERQSANVHAAWSRKSHMYRVWLPPECIGIGLSPLPHRVWTYKLSLSCTHKRKASRYGTHPANCIPIMCLQLVKLSPA